MNETLASNLASWLARSCHDNNGLSCCTVCDSNACPFYQRVDKNTVCRGITVEQWLEALTKVDASADDSAKKRGSVLLEALEDINGERVDQYGNPEDCFGDIADAWQKWLGDVSRPITSRDVAVMMAILKLVREMHAPKRDNLRDACGYLALAADMVKEPTDA